MEKNLTENMVDTQSRWAAIFRPAENNKLKFCGAGVFCEEEIQNLLKQGFVLSYL